MVKLTMKFTTKGLMGFVHKSKTHAWTITGLVWKVVVANNNTCFPK